MPLESAPAELLPAEILATVGHEFRGPLTTIQGYVSTLLHHDQHLTQQERQEFLHEISEAGMHLSRLVDLFLELAQLETHVYPFRPEPVSLLRLTQEAMAASQADRRHPLLLISPLREQVFWDKNDSQSSSDEDTLYGDRRLLSMMLDILLENAITYSDPESLIEVSLDPLRGATAQRFFQAPAEPGHHREMIVSTNLQEQERVLLLRVRDHGIGIDPAHLVRIFQRFYRADTGLTRETNGLGLGLTFCQAIVSAHQGMLWVESALDAGSTFSMVLPCERFLEEEIKRPGSSPQDADTAHIG